MAEEIETVQEAPSLLDTVRAAVQEHTPTEAPTTQAAAEVPAATETAAEKEARTRDEQGRFAAKDKERQTLTLNKAKEAPAVGAPAAQAPEAPKDVPAPAWWKGAGKVDWNRLPAPIKQEMSDFVGRLETERAEVAPLKDLLDVHKPTLVREAGSVTEGVRQLLQFHQLSLDRPLDLINHIARSRGIDLRAAFMGQPSQQGSPQQPPDINSLVAQAVQQHLQPYQEQIEQRQHQQNLQTVQAFAADPSRPYFNDVADDMERLIKGGIAKDLGDAYDKAIKLNPVVSTQLEQQRQKEAEDQRKAAVVKAKSAAAASVRGSPVPDASRQTGGGKKSVLDAAREAFAEHAGT